MKSDDVVNEHYAQLNTMVEQDDNRGDKALGFALFGVLLFVLGFVCGALFV